MNEFKFEELNLSSEVQHAIKDMGYENATEIQERAIPLLLEKKDVVGKSSTGTGKTAAFGIPAVEMAETGVKTETLVICPTRELAMQIAAEMRKYSKYKPGVKCATVYGGESMERQIRDLKTANIVIGTPGRIMDHMNRRTLKLGNLKRVVLDEADEMLKMGFHEDIQTILSAAPTDRQTVMFSATMPPAIIKIADEFQVDPEMIEVKSAHRTTDTIEQFYYQIPRGQKKEAINLLLQFDNPKRAVVFCNTKKMVDELVEYLNDNKFKATGLHGDMKQSQRTQVMNSFKAGRINTLVATDVCARGIDVDDIEAVYNFDIPQEYEYYIHRIGRTGRAGKQGCAYTLVSNRREVFTIRDIERYVHAKITEKKLPTADDIKSNRNKKIVDKVVREIEKAHIGDNDAILEELLNNGYDLEVIASSLIDIIVNKQKNVIPIIQPIEYVSKSNIPDKDSVVLRINVGKNNNITPNHIVGTIVKKTNLTNKNLGKIFIHGSYTDVIMSPTNAELVKGLMNGTKIRGYNAEMEILPFSASGTDSHKYSGKGNGGRFGEKRSGGFDRDKRFGDKKFSGKSGRPGGKGHSSKQFSDKKSGDRSFKEKRPNTKHGDDFAFSKFKKDFGTNNSKNR